MGFAILEITIFCIVNLRPEMKIIATHCTPEVVSNLRTQDTHMGVDLLDQKFE
jgi:hypothetical protein